MITKEEVKKIVDDYSDRGLIEIKTFGEALREWCETYTNRIALIEEGRSISYTQLWKETCGLAELFKKKGLIYKDNVMVQLPNSINFVKVIMALMMIGARPVLMLPTHKEYELEAIAKLAEPVAIVTAISVLGINYVEMAEKTKKKVGSIKRVFTDGIYSGATDINNVIPVEDISSAADIMPDAYDISLFLLSGGTTGIPKLIPKIHAAYLCNAIESAKRCGVTADSVYLAALSVSHDYPLCCPGVIGTMAFGGASVLCKTASLEEVLPWIEKAKVTFTSVVPVVANMWNEVMEWCDPVDLSSLKYILIGAAKFETSSAKKLEENFQCKIIQGYGLGEGVTCFTCPNDPTDVSWNTQGTPISTGDILRIIDEAGNEVSAGESGELIETGPYTFFGYYRAPDLNEVLFTKDGFFVTGDKAMKTPEGNLIILGRVREQINRAGENIVPEEIESLIKKSEYIIEVAVIGISDMELGERTCAVAVKNKKELTLAELRKFLSEIGIAPFKLPDQLIYVEQLPYKNVGKVDKKTLKKMFGDI